MTNGTKVAQDKKLAKSGLVELFDDISEIIDTYKPDIASIEQLFYFKNLKTVIPVAQARGVITMALAKKDVEIMDSIGEIDDEIELISPTIIEPVQRLKVKHMGSINPRLHTDEILLSLAVCAATDKKAKIAMEQLSSLRGSQFHSSVILSPVDEITLKKLGIHVTYEPKRQTEKN